MTENNASILLVVCHICRQMLDENPLYNSSTARSCPEHGDFFLQQFNDRPARIIFRGFDGEDEIVSSDKTRYTRPGRKPGGQGVLVRCEQTGEIFDSVKSAAVFGGVNSKTLGKHLTGSPRHSTVRGYSFTRLTEEDLDKPFVKRPMIGSRREARAIKCDQTGEIFPSISDIARHLGIHRSTFHKHLAREPQHLLIAGRSYTEIH